MDADFVGTAFAAEALAAVDGREFARGIERFDEELRGAARGVLLPVVVGFGHLDVEVGAQRCGHEAKRACEHGDAERVVGAPDDGSVFAEGGNGGLFPGRVARGARDERGARAGDVGGDGGQGLGAGEVDGDVGCGRGGEFGDVCAAVFADDGVTRVKGALLEEAPHASRSDEDDVHGASLQSHYSLMRPALTSSARRRAALAGDMSQSGRRIGPALRPIMLSAVFAGIGFTS